MKKISLVVAMIMLLLLAAPFAYASQRLIPHVQDVTDLPATGNQTGDIIAVIDCATSFTYLIGGYWYPSMGSPSTIIYASPVQELTDLPSNDADNTARVVTSIGKLFRYNGSFWVQIT
jgi:hypothetical protein